MKTTEEPWGFVVYRTSYGDEDLWNKTKQKLEEAKEGEREEIEDEDGNPDSATLVFIENEEQLKDKTTHEIRLIFNPHFGDPVKNLRTAADPLEGIPEGYKMGQMGEFVEHVCLMIDHDSMVSIVNASDEKPGYLIAIDAIDAAFDDNPPWDGTFKLSINAIFAEFYLRTVSDNSLFMGEVRPHDGKIWDGGILHS